MENVRLSELFNKYIQNSISISEWNEFIDLTKNIDNRKYLEDLITKHYSSANEANIEVEELVKQVWLNLKSHIKRENSKTAFRFLNVFNYKRIVPYAAMIFVIIGIGLLLYLRSNYFVKNKNILDASHILPGGNKAELTMPDGSIIDLSQNKSTIVFNGQNEVSYEDGSSVDTHGKKSILNAKKSTFMRLTTPKGGNYQIILPDGSKVWLNAESSLRYPSKFTGIAREVELKGEAFFSVSKSHIPFIVKTDHQFVEVHGTKFDIKAYPETPTTTTLVEGSVSVISTERNQDSVLLKPGLQSILTEKDLSTTTADIHSATSWKNGTFYFHDADIQDIMRQISRWYNITVYYENSSSKVKVNGEIFKDIPLSEAIEILNQLNISCFFDGSKLVIR